MTSLVMLVGMGLTPVSTPVAGVLGMVVGLPRPWDVVLPIAPSLLLAPTFVVMMICVHYAAPEDKRVWSHTGRLLRRR
jgi:hypothetical protein